MRTKMSTMFMVGSLSRCPSSATFRERGTSYAHCVTVSAGFERRPICTNLGACWNSCVSPSISRDSVAEKSNVCRCFGRERTIVRMDGRKPMSSMRSASSSTRNCSREKSA